MNDILKSYGLPESVDPLHVYMYRTGVYGVYEYYYADSVSGNFWQYTNAPEDSEDYDPYAGNAMLVREQPFPGTNPQYFAPNGRKLSVGVPDGVETLPNELYDPKDPTNIWYGLYVTKDGSGRRYIYFDSDIRENLDLWVQYQLRVADASIPAYRAYATKLFSSTVVKDRVLGALLILADQGMYEIKDLIFASVKDLEFIDTTVKLLGRKFLCDPDMLDFMTSLVVDRDLEAPLFVLDTMRGKEPVGIRHITSLFYALKMNPTFLHYWNVNHSFTRIVHRLSLQNVPPEQVLDVAYNELARVFATSDDVRTMIDAKIRDTLVKNYSDQSESLDSMSKQPQEKNPGYAAQPDNKDEGQTEEDETPIQKSLTNINTDDFGVLLVFSDLSSRKSDEQEFSIWLHSSSLHIETPEQEAKADSIMPTPEELAERQNEEAKAAPTEPKGDV